MAHDASTVARRPMTANASPLTERATSGPSNGRAGAEWTSPAIQLRPFVEALDRLGYDINALLEGAGLRRTDLDDPDGMISCTAFPRVISAAIAERRLTNLGARVGVVMPIGAFPLLDYLILTTDTVGDALEQLVRYFHLVSTPTVLALVEEGSFVRLMNHPGTDPFMAEFHTSIVVHHFRVETAGRLAVSSIHLMHEPEDRRDFERMAGCPVQAPSTWSGVEFTRESAGVIPPRLSLPITFDFVKLA